MSPFVIGFASGVASTLGITVAICTALLAPILRAAENEREIDEAQRRLRITREGVV